MEHLYTKYLHDEITDRTVYDRFSARERSPENKTLLAELSAQEQQHYDFWKTLAPGQDIRPKMGIVRLLLLMRAFLGITFTIKFLELHEKSVIEEYKRILPHVPETHQDKLRQIIRDEESHEQHLISQIREKRISYIGFIALGLADAIVEITGVHAGFLGVTGSTLIAGISGVVVGFAAAISMGSAAYLQAKQDTERSPLTSALATGISYISSVFLLALPYFLLTNMYVAFGISTLVGILLIGGFTFYGAVVFDRKFWREFLEAVGLMLGTAIATFVLGEILGRVFHLSPSKF